MLGNQEEDEEEMDVFSDTFDTTDAWSVSGWQAQTIDTIPVPDEEDGNTVVVCSDICTMTTRIDLTGYATASLSFHRLLDDALLTGDNLTVSVKENRTYKTLGSWDKDDADDVWHYNTLSLDGYAGKEITVRFSAKATTFDLSSLFGGDTADDGEKAIIGVDNVSVRGVAGDAPDTIIVTATTDDAVVDSGAIVKVRYNVANRGTTSVRDGTVPTPDRDGDAGDGRKDGGDTHARQYQCTRITRTSHQHAGTGRVGGH